jgi:hypothetical protein
MRSTEYFTGFVANKLAKFCDVMKAFIWTIFIIPFQVIKYGVTNNTGLGCMQENVEIKAISSINVNFTVPVLFIT